MRTTPGVCKCGGKQEVEPLPLRTQTALPLISENYVLGRRRRHTRCHSVVIYTYLIKHIIIVFCLVFTYSRRSGALPRLSIRSLDVFYVCPYNTFRHYLCCRTTIEHLKNKVERNKPSIPL